jgi:hypothetical protein
MTVASHPEPAPPVAWQGVVSTPPAKAGEEFTATVSGFDDEHVFQIRRWESRGGTLPAEGDEVLILVDDQNEPWAPAWWPAESLLEEGEVSSVFGRTGAVVAETGDYTVEQITGAAAQAALEALETKVAAIESEGLPASGKAGGVLAGEYPNPTFAADMATQAELDAHVIDTTSVHGIADTSALVLGPASAKDGGLAAFDGTGGKKLKAAGKIVAEQIEAGTITAKEIAAGTITSKEIAANTITAGNIAAATITGAEIAGATITASNITIAKLSALSADLGTITAGTVTGATLRTAAAGSRVVIDSEGLHAFNATEAVLDFNIGTGNLALKGKVEAGSTVPASTVTGELTAAQIAEITAAKVSGKLTAAQIESIAAAQVTGKLTNAQLEAIEAAKITGSIKGTQIGSEEIATGNIKASAITSALIAANTIVAADIAAEAITATEIKAGTITTTQIAANTIVAGNIAAETITGAKIAGTTIEAKHLVANTITAGQIAAGTITTTEIKAATIKGSNIAAETIEASNIKALTITAAQIAATTITASQIAAKTITGTQIAANTITAEKLTVSTLSAITADLGNVTAGTITGVTFYLPEDTSGEFSKLSSKSSIVWKDTEGNPKEEINGGLNGVTSHLYLLANRLGKTKTGIIELWAWNKEGVSESGQAGVVIEALEGARKIRCTAAAEKRTIIDEAGLSDFLQLTTTAKSKINFGTSEATWPGGSISTTTKKVAHGLGKTPVAVFVIRNVEGPLAVSTFTYTSTEFSWQVSTADASKPGVGTVAKVSWLAIG